MGDFAHVIDAKNKEGLTILLTGLEQQEGIAMVIATIPSLEGADIETFAVDLYKKWGIGKKGEDKGILILASVEDRTARIEVGYGLEAVIPDAFAGRVLREILFPYFQKARYGDGFLTASTILIQQLSKKFGFELKGEAAQAIQNEAPHEWPWPITLVVFLFFLYLFLRHPLLFLMFFGPRSLVPGPWSSRFGGGFRGGSFGGGFGGFGGGLSGGGGASGRW